MKYVHQKSIEYAFKLLSEFTGESESMESFNYLNNSKFKALFNSIVETHSLMLFSQEVIQDSKEAHKAWIELESLFSE